MECDAERTKKVSGRTRFEHPYCLVMKRRVGLRWGVVASDSHFDALALKLHCHRLPQKRPVAELFPWLQEELFQKERC